MQEQGPNYEASIYLDLKNGSELDREIAKIFNDGRITRFREEMDGAFRSRRGSLNEQKELLGTLSKARAQLAEIVKLGKARSDETKRLRTLDTTISKINREVNALEKAQTAEIERQKAARRDNIKAIREQGRALRELAGKEASLGRRRTDGPERADVVTRKISARSNIERLRELRKEQEAAGRGFFALARAEDEANQRALASSRERKDAIRARTAAMKAQGSRLAGLVQSEKAVEAAVNRQTRAYVRSGEAAEDAGQKARRAGVKTTLASQNVLRIIQDSQYGMMGVANNIEQLGESTGRLMAHYRAMGMTTLPALGAALKATFLPLVAGPMALATIVTLTVALASNTDRLAEAYDKVRVKLGLLTRQQMRYNEVARERASIDEAIATGEYEDEYITNASYEQALAAREQRQFEIDDYRSRVSRPTADQVSMARSALDRRVGGRRVRDLLAEREVRLQNGMQATGLQEEALALYNRLMKPLDEWNNMLEKVGEAESRLAQINTTIKKAEAQRSAADRNRSAVVEATEDEGRSSAPSQEAVNAGRFFDLELREMNARGMAEGPEKRVEMIRVQYLRERREIEHQEGLTRAQKNQLIEANRAAERQAVEDAARDVEAAREAVRAAEIAAISDDGDRRLAEIELQFDRERREVLENVELTAEEKEKMTAALDAREREEYVEETKRQVELRRDRARALIEADFGRRRDSAAYGRETEDILWRANTPMFGAVPSFDGRIAEAEREGDYRANAVRQDIEGTEAMRAEEEAKLAAGVYGHGTDEHAAALDRIAQYNERLKALKAEEESVHDRTAEEVKAIEREKTMAIIAGYGEIAQSMGATFAQISDIIGDQSEGAFAHKKKFLYGSAVMDAISSGIGAYRSYMESPIPAPFNAIIAGVESARIVATLMAQAKQIKSMQPGGGGGAGSRGVGGQYTALNGAMTAKRVREYEGDRQARNVQAQNAATNASILKLQRALGDLKVTIDDRTSQSVYEIGQKRVQRNRT